MAGILDSLFGSLYRFITLGSAKGCEDGFEEITEGTIVRCKAKLPAGSPLKSDYLGQDKKADNEVYVKPRTVAEDQQIATGRNCPPGTFPFDGLCWKACPRYYQRQEVNYTAEEQEAAQKAGTPLKRKFRCIAECNQDWHVLDWGDLEMPPNPNYCYHKPPVIDLAGNITTEVAEASRAVDAPFNLDIQAIETVAHPGANSFFNPDGTINKTSTVFEAPGIYAARKKFALGEAEPPMPCTTPNQITSTGRCVKPCQNGFTLFGENCVNTNIGCPVNTVQDESKAFCKPVIKKMEYGPSILFIISALGAISVIGGLTVRAIKARRTE